MACLLGAARLRNAMEDIQDPGGVNDPWHREKIFSDFLPSKNNFFVLAFTLNIFFN